MNRPQFENRPQDRGGRHRHRRGPGGERRHHAMPMTPEGVPAAIADAPKPSPVVFVSAESLARYPWLPPRVIAGSVWRGPAHARVRVDENGQAAEWRSGPAPIR